MTTRTCEVCGHENDCDDWLKCQFCGRWRGTFVCRWCGWKHTLGHEQCLKCGQKRGTSPPEHSG